MYKIVKNSMIIGSVLTAGALLIALNTSSLADAGHAAKNQPSSGTKAGAMPSGKMMMTGNQMGRLKMPDFNPEKGKKLFVSKGCIACHAVNGVGGHDAPAMDAHEMDQTMNPFEFSAKMWNHAPGMIAAQEEAFGEMINFTGEELADIIAFVHNDGAQHGFNEGNLTATARKMMGHGHGGMEAPKAHAEEAGHNAEEAHEDEPGTPEHKD